MSTNPRRPPYWLKYRDVRVEIDYAPCPRCGAMANTLLADNSQPFGVVCPKCGLHPARMTVWDDECKTLIYSAPITAVLLSEMVARARSPQCACSIWEGDVLVARWAPKTGMTYHAGRCGE